MTIESSRIVTPRLSSQQLQTLALSIERKYQPRKWWYDQPRWQRREGYTYGWGLRLKNPPRFWPLTVLEQSAWLTTNGYPDAAADLLGLHAPRWGGVDELIDIALRIAKAGGLV